MEAVLKTFVEKLVAAFQQLGVTSIPFSGAEFQSGISAVEAELKNRLPEEKFDEISDVFLKTPVEETYNDIKDFLWSLMVSICLLSLLTTHIGRGQPSR